MSMSWKKIEGWGPSSPNAWLNIEVLPALDPDLEHHVSSHMPIKWPKFTVEYTMTV